MTILCRKTVLRGSEGHNEEQLREEGDRLLHRRRMAGGVSRGSRQPAERGRRGVSYAAVRPSSCSVVDCSN